MFDADVDERRFLVFQHHIVARLGLFDQGVFEQQRIVFGFNDGEFDVIGMAHQHFGFCQLVFFVAEIRIEPVPGFWPYPRTISLLPAIYKLIDSGIGRNAW